MLPFVGVVWEEFRVSVQRKFVHCKIEPRHLFEVVPVGVV